MNLYDLENRVFGDMEMDVFTPPSTVHQQLSHARERAFEGVI